MKHVVRLAICLCLPTAAYAEARMIHIEQNGVIVDTATSCSIQRNFGAISPASRQQALAFWNTVDHPYWAARSELTHEAEAARMQHTPSQYRGPNPEAYFANEARERQRIGQGFSERLRQMDRDYQAKYEALIDSMTPADRDAAGAAMAIVQCPRAPRR